jgi:outer membrane protein assembly factor BamB
MKRLDRIISFTLAAIAVSSFLFWFWYNPVKHLAVSVPGLDNRPVGGLDTNEVVIIGEFFEEFGSHSSSLKGKWTQFRGADFDNIYKGNTKLIDGFGNEGPRIQWSVELGEGHAAPVIYNGKVYIIDYFEDERSDALRCFSLETGEELWRRSYRVHIKRNHGMSRTVPAINDKYIVTIGPRCHVMCADPNTGDLLWSIDMAREFETEVPLWYTGQCPFIVDDVVVLAPGGTSLLVGVNCATGEVVWRTPNPDGWKMSHSSVVPMEFNGKKMYVYAALGGICGVSAEGNDIGEILWKTTEFSPSVMVPSPLVLNDGKIFITAGYGAGGMLFQLKPSKAGFDVEILQKYKPREGIASEQQTPLYLNGYIYCIQPKDAGGTRNQLVCVKDDDAMTNIWTSGKIERFGLGPYMFADDKIFILSDDGTLTIGKASPRGWQMLDSAKVIDGVDSWGPFAIADGYLLMRDSKQMVCVDIKAKR